MSGFHVNLNFTDSAVRPDFLGSNLCGRCLSVLPCIKGGSSQGHHLNRPHTYHQWVRGNYFADSSVGLSLMRFLDFFGNLIKSFVVSSTFVCSSAESH